ncbi:MAG: hypothetical protein K0U36_03310 [Alphaproteobacteria bacterium]|nr:hypothetical protein [Alphaproteobacteria bacterium]
MDAAFEGRYANVHANVHADLHANVHADAALAWQKKWEGVVAHNRAHVCCA